MQAGLMETAAARIRLRTQTLAAQILKFSSLIQQNSKLPIGPLPLAILKHRTLSKITS